MSGIYELYRHETDTIQLIEEHFQKRDQLEEQIERLKAAKNSIASYKDSTLRLRSSTAGLMLTENWRGENYVKYQENVREGLTRNLNDYYDKVDDAQDQLNLEIAKLQNEQSNILGYVGALQSWLNDIQTAIRNALN